MEKRHFRVLLVEDDEDDYEIFKRMLTRITSTAFSMQWAGTYEAGFDGICSAEYDVTLVDYRLGEKDGLELAREVIARGCEMPIILLTGQGGFDLDIKAMEAGVSDYLVKGQINPDLLERSIRYSIVQKRAELELRRYRNYLEQLVYERTRELEEANSQLQVEIKIRREAEKASRQLAAIVENSNDAIMSLTSAGTIASWNHAAEVIYGYSAEEAIGKPMDFHVPSDKIAEISNLLARVLGGEHLIHYETQRRRKDGEDINVSLTISPVKDDAGMTVGVSIIARDVTERERQRKERERLITELQEALANVKTLKGLFPICAWCKKIRDDQGYWQQIEAYIRDRSDADFSHGICPECAKKAREEVKRLAR